MFRFNCTRCRTDFLSERKREGADPYSPFRFVKKHVDLAEEQPNPQSADGLGAGAHTPASDPAQECSHFKNKHDPVCLKGGSPPCKHTARLRQTIPRPPRPSHPARRGSNPETTSGSMSAHTCVGRPPPASLNTGRATGYQEHSGATVWRVLREQKVQP